MYPQALYAEVAATLNHPTPAELREAVRRHVIEQALGHAIVDVPYDVARFTYLDDAMPLALAQEIAAAGGRVPLPLPQYHWRCKCSKCLDKVEERIDAAKLNALRSTIPLENRLGVYVPPLDIAPRPPEDGDFDKPFKFEPRGKFFAWLGRVLRFPKARLWCHRREGDKYLLSPVQANDFTQFRAPHRVWYQGDVPEHVELVVA